MLSLSDTEPKHALVTGATSGVGKAACAGLVRAGWVVTVVGRSKQRCAAVVEQLNGLGGRVVADAIVADFRVPEQALGVALEYKRRHKRLDVLINNAGAAFGKRQTNDDGIEYHIAVNHLAHFVLTGGLVGLLRDTALANRQDGARVVNVASDLHRVGVSWGDIQLERRYSIRRGYGQSKAMNLLFTKALAQRLQNSGVSVNAVTPGLVNTGIFEKSGSWWLKVAVWGLRNLRLAGFRTAAEGARIVVFAASSAAVRDVTGEYMYFKSKSGGGSYLRQPSAEITDPANWDRLWELSTQWAYASLGRGTPLFEKL